jgi:hypothetical protein
MYSGDVVHVQLQNENENENEPKFLHGLLRRLLPGVRVGRLLRLFLPVPRGRVATIRGSLRRWSLRRRPPRGPVGPSAQTAAICARLLGTPSTSPAFSREIRIDVGKKSTTGTCGGEKQHRSRQEESYRGPRRRRERRREGSMRGK